MRFITGKAYSEAVEEILSSEEPVKCAVAFWGSHWIDYIKELKQPIQIICNLESGATNPKIIDELKGKNNIELRTHMQLHSKVFFTSKHWIIGSANASANGLCFQDLELKDWIEAGIMNDNSEVLEDITQWFQNLWNKSEDVKKMDENKLEKIRKYWLQKRGGRSPDWTYKNKSILEILELEPEVMEDLPIGIAIWSDDATPKAKNIFSKIINTNIQNFIDAEHIKATDLDFFESWEPHLLKPNYFVISIKYERRGGLRLIEIYKMPDPPIIAAFRYDDGSPGNINICVKVKSIKGMTISKQDENLLKQNIKQLWESQYAKGDDGGKFLDLYKAREVLFPTS